MAVLTKAQISFSNQIDELLSGVLDDVIEEAEKQEIPKDLLLTMVKEIVDSIIDSRMS